MKTITCPKYEGPQECYVVCRHLLGSKLVVEHHFACSPHEIGEMLCRSCFMKTIDGKSFSVAHDCVLLCKTCALAEISGRLLA